MCIISSVPPTIIGQTQVPENVSVVVKNPVVLTCEASGMPPPSITWLKDGQPISTSSSVWVISGINFFSNAFVLIQNLYTTESR